MALGLMIMAASLVLAVIVFLIRIAQWSRSLI